MKVSIRDPCRCCAPPRPNPPLNRPSHNADSATTRTRSRTFFAAFSVAVSRAGNGPDAVVFGVLYKIFRGRAGFGTKPAYKTDVLYGLPGAAQVLNQRVDIASAPVQHGPDLGAFAQPQADPFDHHVKEQVLARAVRN